MFAAVFGETFEESKVKCIQTESIETPWQQCKSFTAGDQSELKSSISSLPGLQIELTRNINRLTDLRTEIISIICRLPWLLNQLISFVSRFPSFPNALIPYVLGSQASKVAGCRRAEGHWLIVEFAA